MHIIASILLACVECVSECGFVHDRACACIYTCMRAYVRACVRVFLFCFFSCFFGGFFFIMVWLRCTFSQTLLFSKVDSGQLDLSTFNSKHARTQAPSVNHHDCVLDLKLLELPHRMLVSASRDGVVKVWK